MEKIETSDADHVKSHLLHPFMVAYAVTWGPCLRFDRELHEGRDGAILVNDVSPASSPMLAQSGTHIC